MQIVTNESQKELKSHGSFEFPVFVSEEVLAGYERGSFLWHWHPEIELTFVTGGKISYQVNEQIYHLRAGEGLFCNSNALHTGHMIDEQNCYYISITFHPRIIYGYEGSVLQHSYVNPLLNSGSLASIHFQPEIDWQRDVIDAMNEIHCLYKNRSDLFEMQIQQKLSFIWLQIMQNETFGTADATGHTARDVERLRVILSYLHEHYMEKITLNDIARAARLCKEECCRFFKKNMSQSLFDYLMYYRIEKSLPLLAHSGLSITEIAEQTGFSGSSYYARIFKEQLGCTPTEYRNGGLQ